MEKTNRKAMISLSKTILKGPVLTKRFCKFISHYISKTFGQVPTTAMDQYVFSVLESSTLLFAVVMSSLNYMSRIESRLCTESVKRTWVASLILAMKALCDQTYSNLSWEKISGIPLHELNQEERKLFRLLNYDLILSESKYFKWLSVVEEQIETYKASYRAHFISDIKKLSSIKKLEICM